MHSLHQLKKWQRDDEKLADIKRRVECQDNEAHFFKTQDLANRYEMRVDTWLRDAGEKHPAPVGKVKTVHGHSFRDRNSKLELDHARISPNRYTLERKRIEDTIASRMITFDPWQGYQRDRGGRTRDKSKELHPNVRFKDISTKGRIEDFLKTVPCPRHRPWSQMDNPAKYQIRDIEKLRWSAGGFDALAKSRYGYPHDYLGIAEPFAPPFGSREDDFRPRDGDAELFGEFRTNVPGYFPDVTPGKWMQDPNIAVPGSPLAKSAAMKLALTSTKVLAGRPVVPKSYWKASAQIQIEKKEAVERYHTITERAWEEHRERAATATRLIAMHYDLNGNTVTHTGGVGTAFRKAGEDLGKSIPSAGGSHSRQGSFHDNASIRSLDL